jgi:hypothetical protein
MEQCIHSIVWKIDGMEQIINVLFHFYPHLKSQLHRNKNMLSSIFVLLAINKIESKTSYIYYSNHILSLIFFLTRLSFNLIVLK